MNRHIHILAKHAKLSFACGEIDLVPKKMRHHFFRLQRKRVRHMKNGVRQAAPRLRLKVKRRKSRGKCAPAQTSPVLRPDPYLQRFSHCLENSTRRLELTCTSSTADRCGSRGTYIYNNTYAEKGKM